MMFGGALLSIVGSLLIFSGTIALLSVGYRESKYMLDEFTKAAAKQGSTIGGLQRSFATMLETN
jgi:hypothetical protein